MPIVGGHGRSSHLGADTHSRLPGSVPTGDLEILLNQVQGSSFVESPGNKVPVVHELGGGGGGGWLLIILPSAQEDSF